MIETAKSEGREQLIHFTSDGTAVQLSSPFELEEHLFPKFFVSGGEHAQLDMWRLYDYLTDASHVHWQRHQNFASFKRQLSMYGFLRVLEGRLHCNVGYAGC